jgi:toluene monooxygenase system protein E
MNDSTAPIPLKPLRTWSHLADKRKRPSEYDIVTRKFLYNTSNLSQPDTPFELDGSTFMQDWYRRYRNHSAFSHADWDSYTDPFEMVYRTYNLMQDGQENYVTGLFAQFSEREQDLVTSAEWLNSLAAVYTPSRYLFHALQMASIYLGSIAPSASIANVFYFESADCLRWVSHTAYRTAEMKKHRPEITSIGAAERSQWEDGDMWQGFRELMEKVLVTYDWSEAFVALQLLAKPAIEACLLHELGRVARHNDDQLLGLLTDAQFLDAQRHRRQSVELRDFILSQDENKKHVEKWQEKWLPLTESAVRAYLQGLIDDDESRQEAFSRVSTQFPLAAHV